jgi:hypothetical protein
MTNPTLTEYKRFKNIGEAKLAIQDYKNQKHPKGAEGLGHQLLRPTREEITRKALKNIESGSHGPTWAKLLLAMYD